MNKDAPFKERLSSRKFLLFLLILACGTSILLAPAFLKLVSGVGLAYMMTGGEYVTLIISSFAIYSGANVAQRKIEGPLVNIDGGPNG
jgi:uncharacterized membrane protein (DUF2068 family)